jgi:hypothetical protein
VGVRRLLARPASASAAVDSDDVDEHLTIINPGQAVALKKDNGRSRLICSSVSQQWIAQPCHPDRALGSHRRDRREKINGS